MKKALLCGSMMMGALAAVTLWSPSEAEACGGCFVSQTENTQVTGHRMALSISTTQSTLYDQITYSGAPESFAWILPIRGQVDIGLSSDALFAALEGASQVSINSPVINCNSGGSCGSGGGFPGSNGAGGGGGGDGGVEVIAQEVVGPYETVQLSATDPEALVTWLTSHGYTIPADIEPVIDSYVAEKFDFLAMRLVPGQGIDSMRPVRITTPGVGASLPLRMVAAGTGANTAITLWVVSEGRYEPQNFPTFQILQQELVWDWDAGKSNYSTIRANRFAESNGFAWHLESGEPMYDTYTFDSLVSLASYDPAASGYGDAQGAGAVEEAQADIDTLLAGINPQNLWVSRMGAELSRAALGEDLALHASEQQRPINRWFNVENAIGTPPPCPPPPPPCGEDGFGDDGGGGASVGGGGGGAGCAVSPSTSSRWLLVGLSAVAALAVSRRRRAVRTN